MSVHDGPGCRTLVFMQGCTLNCNWCSNPEGISKKPELLYRVDNCRLDGNCIADCNFSAITIENKKLIIDRRICDSCTSYSCINNCYTKALSKSAKEMCVTDLIKIVNRDRQYWGKDGGVTLSGGEPLLQIDFVDEFLRKCHNSYIHTAIETCGNLPWSNFSRVLPFVDWIFIDFKHPDSAEHKAKTGSGNMKIVSNIQRLKAEFLGKIVVRIPVIPGYNNTDEAISGYLNFFMKNNIEEVNILPLHHLGREKYTLLGLDYEMDHTITISKEEISRIEGVFTSAGIVCYSGHLTPF